MLYKMGRPILTIVCNLSHDVREQTARFIQVHVHTCTYNVTNFLSQEIAQYWTLFSYTCIGACEGSLPCSQMASSAADQTFPSSARRTLRGVSSFRYHLC